jgi:feruloyl esterase
MAAKRGGPAMRRSLPFSPAALILAAAFVAPIVPSARAASCESLAQLKFPDTTITAATSVATPLSVRSGGGAANVTIPFCRVEGFLAPTTDSHIGFEVWLPRPDAWNHKFEGVGNGGFAGFLNYPALVPGLKRGYAVMTTDEGHVNIPTNPVEDVTWALDHPEKTIDYAYRAEHLATITAQKIVEVYFGGKPTHSYYAGCSAGGIQGIVEETRFPADYDGYIIGDASPDHLGQEVGAAWNVLAASLADPANAIQAKQLPQIHDAVLKQCAGKDGGLATDRFLTDPRACEFDPTVLLCAAGQEASTCLSVGQVANLQKMYRGAHRPDTGEQVAAGLTPGSELMWDRLYVGKSNPIGTERPWAGFFADIAYRDADYLKAEKYLKFNFGSDLDAIRKNPLGTQTVGAVFGDRGANLDPVRAEGAKVIQYHGWDDGNITPRDGVDYLAAVVKDQEQRRHLAHDAALSETQTFYRLFMVQGMDHCTGGAGATNFGQVGQSPMQIDPHHDTLSALEQWVEHQVAPEYFIGSHVEKTGDVTMTRPICVYPQIPVYKGSGSTTDARNFSCDSKR